MRKPPVRPAATAHVATIAALLCAALWLGGCGSNVKAEREVHGEDFSSGHLVQSGLNRFANLTMRDNLDSLELLLEKLYRRNPAMWRASGAASRDEARQRVMTAIRNNQPWPDPQVPQRGVEAIRLSLASIYSGDRAGLFIYGLGTMLIDAWGDHVTLHILNGLDAQRVANASHNVMVAAWLLASRKDAAGQPLLLADDITAEVRNLSFEREFGKIIGRLDTLAAVTDEKYKRSVIDYLQGLVGGMFMQFIPLDAAAGAVTGAAAN